VLLEALQLLTPDRHGRIQDALEVLVAQAKLKWAGNRRWLDWYEQRTK
jgi:hypothetical protein